jgi:trk system potassium uptake protein TrkH
MPIQLMRLMAIPGAALACVFLVFASCSVFIFNDHLQFPFFILSGVTGLISLVLWHIQLKRTNNFNFKIKFAPIFAVASWVLVGLLASLPFILVLHLPFYQAMFESFSAISTTGATVITDLDSLPETILLYRQFLQWLGGLGIVIFVVAVLPNLNIGGMKLLKAEVPGPIKNEKLAARTKNSAHYLWGVYVLLTVACAIMYRLFGMSSFDAIAHSLSTVSTGGFSTHNDSFGYFHSETLYVISDVFMILGALNFGLLFISFQSKSLKQLFNNEETKTFLAIIIFVSFCAAGILIFKANGHGLSTINHAVFITISFITSTGFGAEDFTNWPTAVLFLLVISAYLGGCSGSTAGGGKIIRAIVLFKIVRRQMKLLIHPRGVFQVRYQGRPIDESVLSNTLAFVFFVIISTVILAFLLMIDGLDVWTALTAVAACLNVLGPAFGSLSENFSSLNNFDLSILSFAMVLGRLEYLTVILLFLPGFWRK